MCCLFGVYDYKGGLTAAQKRRLISALATASEARGTDATGIAYNSDGHLSVYKRPWPAHLMRFRLPENVRCVMGHTRMTTQGDEKQNCNNHPFIGTAGIPFALAHNGIIYNDRELRQERKLPDTNIETDSYVAVQLLEQQGKLKAVITQNIDGLHQKAGSREVLELHGSVLRNYCEHCGRFYSLEDLMEKKELVPKCNCGGIIKPDVVLYEESLNQKTLEQSVRYISQADMLIVGGTSLTVYPAAGLIDYYRGNKLVLINMAATVRDGIADLIIKRKIGEALSEAVE